MGLVNPPYAGESRRRLHLGVKGKVCRPQFCHSSDIILTYSFKWWTWDVMGDGLEKYDVIDNLTV